MDQAHKPSPAQKKSAVVTAIVLVALVLGIYAVFMLKFAAR